MRKVLVTGTAGFIGYHLAETLLANGNQVIGFDGITDYYDVNLKYARHEQLSRHEGFTAVEARLEDHETLLDVCHKHQPSVIVHLAAQAGVRHSLEHPRSYISANVLGTMNVLEAARELDVDHLLMASTASVFGGNTDLPFAETHKADTQMSLYAATKKATEAMGHSQAHIFGFPVTMFRFFSAYGTWGRPDMALYKFTKAMLAGEPIDVYNHGDMYRDFTYVADLVEAIRLLMDQPPSSPEGRGPVKDFDSISPIAPFRIVNIGNSSKIRLLDYIKAIEEKLGVEAKMNFLPMQPGDVPASLADTSLLQHLTGYKPQVAYKEGVARFVDWYLEYHHKAS